MSILATPVTWHDATEHLRKLAESVNGIIDGRSNAYGTVTLDANQATTTLTDRRIAPDSCIGLMPETANAAAEIGAGTFYVSARTSGSATLTHANNAQADRTYTYAIVG